MTKKVLLPIILLTLGCEVDRRNADVVVGDYGLTTSVAEVIGFWQYATNNDLSMILTDHCELSTERSCVVIRSGEVGEDLGQTRAWNRSGVEHGSWITIELQNDNDYNKFVIAHEIGHALGLSDVEEEIELMHDEKTWRNKEACIGKATIAEYKKVYGSCSGCREVCLFER